MPGQEAIQAAFVDLVANEGFQGKLDFHGRCQFSSSSTLHKGSEEGAFLFQGEILTAPPAFPWRLDSCHSSTLVAGNHLMDGCQRDSNRLSNVLGLTGSCQRLINDLPALATPRALFPLHPLLDG